MPKKSIIERIADDKKKKEQKRRARLTSKMKKVKTDDKELTLEELEQKKKELEAKLSAGAGEDNALLARIKAELAEKKSTGAVAACAVGSLESLVESGSKEDWVVFFGQNLKAQVKMELPQIDPEQCKFPDYGYRQLIELILDSEDFLRLIIDIKDISGFQLITMNSLIRGDDATLRGIESLCNLIINKEVTYNPVMETDFKYLNIILDAFTIPKKEGINKIWTIKYADTSVSISASFDRNAGEWNYKLSE